MAVVVDNSGTPITANVEATGYGFTQHDARVEFWLQSSLQRVYPSSRPDGGTKLALVTPRNARLSFQACFRNDSMTPTQVHCEVVHTPGLKSTVRRVGYVPQRFKSRATFLEELDGGDFVPGFVPDPLFPEQSALVYAFSNQTFWVTVDVSSDLAPGIHHITVNMHTPLHPEQITMQVELDVRPLVLRPRHDFPVTHWWCPDCIWDWYKLEPFGEEFWAVVRPYLQNMFDHGSNTIYVPLLNLRREIVQRPPQLLRVQETAPGQYAFDWTLVRRFVQMAKEIGFEHFEWTYFWAYCHDKTKAFSASTPTSIYTERNGRLELLFPAEMDGTGPVFRNYLEQFIPEFKQFLTDEGILTKSFFHLSDEPGSNPSDIENYGKARQLLKDVAPWMKVMDAMGNPVYVEKGLTDMPIPIAWKADRFREKGYPHWVYYCCSPLGPFINRFFDTPLAKLRVQGFMFYHLGALGFLHWGFNYWYEQNGGFNKKSQVLIDPHMDASAGGGYPYGDPFVVYPTANGPIDSLRWEVFAEALQDYALLQTLGVSPNDELLQPIMSYSDFPKNEAWFKETYVKLLARAEQAVVNNETS